MKVLQKVMIVFGAIVLAACDASTSINSAGGDSSTTPAGPFAKFSVLHASPDAPKVNVLVDGAEVLTDVDYSEASIEGNITAGTHSVEVVAVLPGGATASVFGPADVDFAEDTITTIAAVGPVAIPLDVAVSVKPDADPAAGAARVAVLHATSGPGGSLPVDVYVTAPGAMLSASAPLNTTTFDFKDTLGPVEVAAGDYQIRVTLEGDLTPVYDSGTVTVDAGIDVTLAAVPNVSGGPAAVTLIALASDGSGAVYDVNTPTAIRVGHLSSDTGTVDVLVNGGVFLDNVDFPAVTGFTPLDPATYTVAVAPDGMPTMPAIGPVDLALEAGTWYSVLAVGLSGDQTLTADILTDDPRPVALYAKVRIYHAAPAAQAIDDVDIYVTAVGADINNETPLLTAVPFGANTGYLAVDEGQYDVTVTLTGTKNIAIGPATIDISAGGVYTAIARDPLPGASEFGLIVLADTLDQT